MDIIEKSPWYDNSLFTGDCWMYPTYMVKDGKEFFMFNRRDPDDAWALRELEACKTHLRMTGGRYFKFHGLKDDPIDWLKLIAYRKHHFTDPDNLYYCSIEEKGFLDFHGNLKEVSAAFFYRIYDKALAEQVQKLAALITQERFEEVINAADGLARYEQNTKGL